MIRAVLFDMDGVLVDSIEAWFHLVNGVADAFGYARVSRQRFNQCWGQGIDADSRTFFEGKTVEEIEKAYVEHFREHTHHIVVEADAPNVLSTLRRDGIRTAVITNTPTPIAREVLTAVGLKPDALVGATDVDHDKPAPDMVIEACRKLEVGPAHAIVVGDSRYDRDAAAAAGVRFAGLGIDGDDRLESLSEVLGLVSSDRPH